MTQANPYPAFRILHDRRGTIIDVSPPLSFWARVRRVPFWKLWLFTLAWAFTFPVGVLILGLTFGFSFGADSAAKAWLAAGLAVLFMSLLLFFAVRKKLGYG